MSVSIKEVILEFSGKDKLDVMVKLMEAREALAFYADHQRYCGPNCHPIPNDVHQPRGLIYRLDVTRDGGQIARAALGIKEAL